MQARPSLKPPDNPPRFQFQIEFLFTHYNLCIVQNMYTERDIVSSDRIKKPFYRVHTQFTIGAKTNTHYFFLCIIIVNVLNEMIIILYTTYMAMRDEGGTLNWFLLWIECVCMCDRPHKSRSSKFRLKEKHTTYKIVIHCMRACNPLTRHSQHCLLF